MPQTFQQKTELSAFGFSCSSLVRQIDFKLHILSILNDLDMWAVILPMVDHSKITKNAFLDDPKSQKSGF